MTELNFNREERLVVKANTACDWTKIPLNSPITIIDGKADLYSIGQDFVGILSNKDLYRQFVEIELLKPGFVYTVACDDAVTVGSFLTAGDNGRFVVSATGVLKVTKLIATGIVGAVGYAQGGGGGGGTYTLPTATATRLGGIKVGANLEIDANGVLKGTATYDDTVLRGLIAKEETNRKTEDTNLDNKIKALLKIYDYKNGLAVKSSDLVLHGGKIYIVKTDTTLSTWDVDEPNLIKTDSDTISCVDYVVGIKIERGQLVIYNKQLYICDATINNTTTWDADKDKMILTDAEVDLTNYYNKTQTDVLLDKKEDKLTAGEFINLDKANNNTIKVISDTDANVNTLVKRTNEGAVNIASPTVFLDTTAINNKKLTTELDKKANQTDLEQEIQERKDADGDLTTLKTESKDDLVKAINSIQRTKIVTQTEYNQMVIDGTVDNEVIYQITNDEVLPVTDNQFKEFFDKVYPIGSIYFTMDDAFSPATAFGGTWEKIETGRYLRAVDTGAGTEHSESLPNITGEIGQRGGTNTNRRGMDGAATGAFSFGSVAASYSGAFDNQTGYSIKFNANSSSAVYQDGAKVMPDSIDVIMWRRIA